MNRNRRGGRNVRSAAATSSSSADIGGRRFEASAVARPARQLRVAGGTLTALRSITGTPGEYWLVRVTLSHERRRHHFAASRTGPRIASAPRCFQAPLSVLSAGRSHASRTPATTFTRYSSSSWFSQLVFRTSTSPGRKTFLWLYYRPIDGAGEEIMCREIAEKFAADVEHRTDRSISVDTIARFSELKHDVHHRGGVLTWSLDNRAQQFF